MLHRMTYNLLEVISLRFDWSEIALSLAQMEHVLREHAEHEEAAWRLDASVDRSKVAALLLEHAELARSLRDLRIEAEEHQDPDELKAHYVAWLAFIDRHELLEKDLFGSGLGEGEIHDGRSA